ncbi:MAG: CBS domain-containing protein [Planctomycetota bacterium]|jgi:predicted transcriptional regulator
MAAGPTKVRDLMDTKSVTLKADLNLSEAIDILIENKITGAAVVDDEDRVIGILSELDCLKTLLNAAYNHMPATALVSEYMSTEVFTIEPDMDIFKLADLFLKKFYRRFPVVENGKLVGQITRRDLLRLIHRYNQ